MDLRRPRFGDRRRRLLEALDGVAIFFAAPVATRNATVQHAYRQDSDLYYFTGFEEPESVLVVAPAHAEHRVVLFVRPRDVEREAWDGPRAGVVGAVEQFGADAAYPISELAERLPSFFAGHERIYHRLGKDAAADARVIDALTRARGRGRTARPFPEAVVDLARIVHEMRVRKDDDEVARMRRAAEITRDGHLAAMRLAAPGKHEFELEAALTEVFRRSGSERWAYQPIVGSGPNAAVLHHRSNRRRMQEGELVLIDAGCELEFYASDVTRTFPVSGSFSPAHRALYEAVLEAQLEAITSVRPGATLDAIHTACERRLAEAMVRLGLVAGPVDRAIEQREHMRYFNHRTSHWLGMDVHDVGAYYEAGSPRPIEAGMVFTIEPGIYVREDDARAPAALRGVGVRIEDDVLVTEDGCSVLTADVPKSIDDIERACRA